MFNFLVIIGSKVIKKKMGWRLITTDETNSTVNIRCSKFILILIRIKHKHSHELPVNDNGILKSFLTVQEWRALCGKFRMQTEMKSITGTQSLSGCLFPTPQVLQMCQNSACKLLAWRYPCRVLPGQALTHCMALLSSALRHLSPTLHAWSLLGTITSQLRCHFLGEAIPQPCSPTPFWTTAACLFTCVSLRLGTL